MCVGCKRNLLAGIGHMKECTESVVPEKPNNLSGNVSTMLHALDSKLYLANYFKGSAISVQKAYIDLVGDEDTITTTNDIIAPNTTPSFVSLSFNEFNPTLTNLDISYCNDETKIFINDKGEYITKLQLLKLIEDSKWSRKMGFSE